MTEPPRPPGEEPGARPPGPSFDRPATPGPTSGPPSTPPPPPPGEPPGGYPPPGHGGYQPPPGQGGYPPPPGQGGYPPPPGQGGYPPPPGQGGYPPPGYGYPSGGQYGGPPAGYANQDDKTWALIAHFGGAAGVFLGGWLGFLAPLVALLARGKESPTVRSHAVSALNFQLTWIGISVALSLVFCCLAIVTLGWGAFGFGLLAVPWLIATIFGLVAGVKANDGELYRYPMSINIVK